MPFGGGLTLGLVGAGAAGKAVNYITSDNSEEKALSGLKTLASKPLKQYAKTPELQAYYSRVLNGVNNPMGLTAAEKGVAENGIATGVNTVAYNARVGSNGNDSLFLKNALTPQIAGAEAGITVADAKMKQENMLRNLGILGNVTGQIQGIDNMNTEAEQNRNLILQQALGQSVLQNKANKTNAIDSLSSDLIGGGLMLGINKFAPPVVNPYKVAA